MENAIKLLEWMRKNPSIKTKNAIANSFKENIGNNKISDLLQILMDNIEVKKNGDNYELLTESEKIQNKLHLDRQLKQDELTKSQINSINTQIEFHSESINELKNGWKERLIFLFAGAIIAFGLGIAQFYITKETPVPPQEIHIQGMKVLIVHDTIYVKR
jgi:hypothetical protein